jgi:hypothetical protein
MKKVHWEVQDLETDAFVVWEETEQMMREVRKLVQKGNKSAGVRARAILHDLHHKIIPMREAILKHSKSLPVKQRKK